MDWNTDCTGYLYKGKSGGYIYYGEEDQQVVYWGLAYTVYDNTLQPYEWIHETYGPVVDEAERVIERMNRFTRKSGVYIRFFLEKASDLGT